MAYLDYNGLSYFKQKNDALYAKATDLSNLSDVVAQKANIDGSYESMTVGNAEQLVSTVGVEDSAPYTFRTTGGSADVGDRLNLKKVIGGTVAWNQNLKEVNSTNWAATAGSTNVSIADGVATVTAGAQYGGLGNTSVNRPTFADGHKMFYSVAVKLTTAVANAINVKINVQDQKFAADSTEWQIISGFFTWDSTKTATFQILDFRASDRDAYQVKEPMLIDLTAMFGSTIADYAYTLESGTAGAGIAWLKKYGYFTKPYYPYAAASLESVKTSAHKTIGFNQWDEESSAGYWDISSGSFVSGSNTWRGCTNYIRCLPNTGYFFHFEYTGTASMGAILFYDGNKNFISSQQSNTRENVVTTPANCYYMTFYANMAYFDTGICINLHWDGEMDGQYAPFEQHTYALDDVELRGVPKLDASNNLYYNGDVYTPDGTVTRNRGRITFDGSSDESWGVQVNSGGHYLATLYLTGTIKAWTNDNKIGTLLSNMYPCGSWESVFVGNPVIGQTGSAIGIGIDSLNITTADAWKTWLASNNLVVEFDLATPTTESADPFTELQICNDFGTEEFVDAATRDFEMPCGSLAVYRPNLRAKLEMSCDSPSGSGDYIVRQTDGLNEYVAVTDNSTISGLMTRCPACPTDTDGTFVLKATVSGGTVTYSWVSE